MSSAAVGQLMWLYGVRPGRRAVVVADNPDGYGTALDLLDAGVLVEAVLEPVQLTKPDRRRDALAARGIEIGYGYGVREALASEAGRHLNAITIERLNSASKSSQKPLKLNCDLLCIAAHPVPNFALGAMAGATSRYSPAGSAMSLINIPEGIQLSGSIRGCWSVEEAIENGREIGRLSSRSPATTIQVHLQKSIISSAAVVSDTAFVDFASEVTLKQIYAGLSKGRPTVAGLCREVGLGNAYKVTDQAVLSVYDFLADHSATLTDEQGREAKFKGEGSPVALAVVAAEAPVVLRRGPLDSHHLSLSAAMCLEDDHWAPAFYGVDGKNATQSEIAAVRSNVGLLDRSGLGKLRVKGAHFPDLLQCMSVGIPSANTQFPTSQLFLLKDNGAVLSTGELIRLDDEDFLLVAPHMALIGIQKRISDLSKHLGFRADILDQTGDLSFLSIAGPQAGRIVENFGWAENANSAGDAQSAMLGEDAFLIRRSDAIGEIEFSVFAPVKSVEHIWKHLLTEGEGYALRPVGQEAFNVLRLEKARICFHRDIDLRTHIGEIIAVAGIKDFDASKCARQLAKPRRWQGLERRLVGISSPGTALSVQPGNPVLQGGRISGRVTSIAFSPTVGCWIGLAYVAPDQAIEGDRINVLDAFGKTNEMIVTPVPFYDPYGRRQEVGPHVPKA
jgi:sarcosine oxidase subunit alpha